MKKLVYFGLIISAAFFLNGCGDDDPTPDDQGDTENPTDSTGTDDPKAALTPEEHKENLAAIGVEFVSEMAALQQTNSTQSMTSFGLLVDLSESDGPEGGSVIGQMNNRILALANGKITPNEFAHMAYRPHEEGSESLEQFWNESKGTYDWDATINDWAYTEGGSVIQFNFPSETNGTTNNCSLTLRNYEGIVIDNPISEDYAGDLPTSFEMDLAVDGTKEMAYSFTIDYSSEGEPEQVDTELFMNPFTLSVSLTNTEVKVGTQVTFLHDEKVLIDVDTDLNGDFDDDTIEGVENSEDPSDVFKDGTISVTLLNFNMAASLDFEKFYAAAGDMDLSHDKLDGEPTEDFEANAKRLEEALNKYSTLTTSYVDTKTKIADAEWYTYVEEDADYIDIYLGARMVFADSSKVDIEDYFASGFSQLESEINDLLDQIGDDIDEDLGDVDFED